MATTEERLTALETAVADIQNDLTLRVKTDALTSILKSITLKQQTHDTDHSSYNSRISAIERSITTLFTTVRDLPSWDGVHVGKSVTADYTVQDETFIAADPTSASITITIPGASTVKWRQITVKKIDTGVNTVTIGTSDSSTIDGSSTKVLTSSYESATMVSDGVNWYLI